MDDIKAKLEQAGKNASAIVMKVTRVEMENSIKLNFIRQGRNPSWPKKSRPDGRAILTGKTGRLQRTISTVIEGDRIIAGTNLPYARIHQEGGTINMPARKIKFRKSRKKTKNGKTRQVFAKDSSKRYTKEVEAKAYIITIPQRRYLAFYDEDAARLLKLLASSFK